MQYRYLSYEMDMQDLNDTLSLQFPLSSTNCTDEVLGRIRLVRVKDSPRMSGGLRQPDVATPHSAAQYIERSSQPGCFSCHYSYNEACGGARASYYCSLVRVPTRP